MAQTMMDRLSYNRTNRARRSLPRDHMRYVIYFRRLRRKYRATSMQDSPVAMRAERRRTQAAADMFPRSTDYGCYPLIYLTKEGDTLCPDCARAEWVADPTQRPTADIHYEGEEYCAGCNKALESAYGDPEEPTDNAAAMVVAGLL